MVNHESGLLGVSGTSADMRELLARRGRATRAPPRPSRCSATRRARASARFAAALGGLDTLVFAGGIGENAAAGPRAHLRRPANSSASSIDAARNAAHADLIPSPTGRVAVHVIRTDEERVIARAVRDLLALDALGQESPP